MKYAKRQLFKFLQHQNIYVTIKKKQQNYHGEGRARWTWNGTPGLAKFWGRSYHLNRPFHILHRVNTFYFYYYYYYFIRKHTEGNNNSRTPLKSGGHNGQSPDFFMRMSVIIKNWDWEYIYLILNLIWYRIFTLQERKKKDLN